MKADPARETEKQTEDRYAGLYRRSAVLDTKKGEDEARRMGDAVYATRHPYPRKYSTSSRKRKRQGGKRK